MTSTLPSAQDISNEIQSVILTKNPVALFFWLSKLRSLFEDLADNLLSNIEKTYYQESTSTFIDLIREYEQQGFNKIMNAYYYDIWHYKVQKLQLDRYFEESYWQDVDFYFFVLLKHPEIQAKISILHTIYLEGLESSYLNLGIDKRGLFLESLASKLELDVRDMSKMPSFSAFFSTLVPEISWLRTSGLCDSVRKMGNSHIKFIKELYMFSLSQSNPLMVDFWRTYFVEDSAINRNLIDLLEDQDILDCFAYLRNKLLTHTKYNLFLSDSSTYRTIINDCILMQRGDVSQKMNFLGSIHASMGMRNAHREQFQNVLRKGMLYQNSIDLVDAILWITFLKRSVFYEIRRRVEGIDPTKYRFESLDEVTKLIQMLESSIILRFFKPFFIFRLAQVFNKRTELYYFIKFVLTVHTSHTYGEYQELSKFFVSLEAFEKKWWYGMLLKTVQFGWVIIAIVIASLIVPFGTFFAGLAYGLTRSIRRFMDIKFPELALTSNFQLGSFLLVFAVMSLSFGLTFWLKDNMFIVYRNFQSVINASTLVASETIKVLNLDLFKASWLEGGGENTGFSESEIFTRINYLDGIDYQKASKTP